MDKSKQTQKQSFASYKKQVLECLVQNERLTETEAKSWMTAEWENPTPSGATTAEEELREYWEEGLPAQTAAKVLVA